MTLPEEVQALEMYSKLRSAAVAAHNFKINESSTRTIVKKEENICEAIAAVRPAGVKSLLFFGKIPIHLVSKCIPID